MATTITKRVTAAASGGATQRVTGSRTDTAYDCWGGSWGSSWAFTWFNRLTASELSNITLRVPSGAVASSTKRVTI